MIFSVRNEFYCPSFCSFSLSSCSFPSSFLFHSFFAFPFLFLSPFVFLLPARFPAFSLGTVLCTRTVIIFDPNLTGEDRTEMHTDCDRERASRRWIAYEDIWRSQAATKHGRGRVRNTSSAMLPIRSLHDTLAQTESRLCIKSNINICIGNKGL